MTDPFDTDLRDRLTRLADAVPVEASGSTTVVRPRIRSGSIGRRFALGGVPLLAAVVVGTVIAGIARVGPFAPAATGTLPSAIDEPNDPVTTTVTDGPFELTIRSAKARYGHGEPIEIEAALSYRGPDPQIQISHDLGTNGGPMAFGILEPVPVEGGEIRLRAGYPQFCRADMRPCLQPASICVETPLGRDAGRTDTFEKRIHDGADVPDGAAAEAAQAYLREPDLHLPSGIWRPYVIAEFSQGDARPCGDYAMRAEIEIQVLEPGPPASEVAPPTNSTQAVTVRDGDFELTLRSDKTTYRPNELIEVTGSLGYSGPEDRVEIAHDASGLILFGSREPVYGNINLSTATRGMCMRSVLERNVPVDLPFRKGGGFPSDHPDVDFFRAFMLDPALRLPAGTWHLYAVSSGGCVDGQESPQFALEAEIAIEVRGEPVVIPSSSAPPAAPTPQIAPDEPPSQIQPDGSVLDVVDDGAFELKLRAGEAVYIANAPIDVLAELRYHEIEQDVDMSGAIVIGFGLSQLDGPLEMGWGAPATCGPLGTLSGGGPPLVIPFAKGAAFGEDDPDREFWEAYMADRVLRLPEGTWQIFAVTAFSLGPSCKIMGPSLGASVTIKVVP